MKLEELLRNVDYDYVAGSLDKIVEGVEFDSRKVTVNSLFVAVIGFKSDGHSYIEKAIEQGASVIVVDAQRKVYGKSELEKISADKDVTFIEAKDNRIALAQCSSSFYGLPQNKLDIFGVTGTKGKTTTTFMLYEIFKACEDKSGLIGTVCNIVDGMQEKAIHTTPESKDLYELLGRFVSSSSRRIAMEVSSQGLKLNRTYGLKYKIACFTNLYEDHIAPEEHPDMEDYLRCKLKIFDTADIAVVNGDSNEAARVLAYAGDSCKSVITYGFSNEYDCYATDVRPEQRDGTVGTCFNVVSPWYKGEIFIPIPGDFNVYNALCALCVAGVENISFDIVKTALEGVFVPGRLQSVKNNQGFSCVVDYAHNAASLESVLKALRGYTEHEIITVFGCGGQRAIQRRFEMGEVSGKYSDLTVITSDNPRGENPSDIIENIITGIEKTDGKYIVIPDRKEAISYAVQRAKKGDMILIAGKGHEDYQIFADRTIHFDDFETATEIIGALSEEKK